jgi:GH43 family beta-xylosidase
MMTVGCSGAPSDLPDGAPVSDDGAPASPDGAPVSDDGASPTMDGAPAMTCTTRITYAKNWIHGASHPAQDDVANGLVTWDGTCTDDGASSYALLSNGWKPYFSGNGGCMMALDSSQCGAPSGCSTRVTYGSAWLHPGGHPAQFDDVAGRVTWDGVCANGVATLSNGWTPTFNGASACELSFEYTGCVGLYANPVVAVDCPDPGVLVDGKQYVMTCTSGGAADAFPIRTSIDLVTWTQVGSVFPSGKHPSWATGDFWAAEIHKVGTQYVVYFTARNSDGKLSVGAASAPSATGPFTDLGHPLLHDPSMGLIDPNEFEAPDGTRYVLWKEDGNAVGKPTPIHAQQLAPDGLSVVGSPSTLITNDQPWEGALVEGPWMIEHGGTYYLFYSGNGYATTAYAIGVARASSPLGPFTKLSQPILRTAGAWAGPGHCSVVDTPDGETQIVYHAWVAGQVGAAPGRLGLVDRIVWTSAGWPSVPDAPSSRSTPLP